MAEFDPSVYALEKCEEIAEANARGTLLRHRKSGARIFLMENDDENKVFYISFRTPPADSTGVPHILEHTVLSGSEKYPLKDPFVELSKGSLNTFLNALTYPDKTVYPLASCNEADFRNLMDVYMDAVLHPAIYQKKEIFLQEGWRYELDEETKELSVNGVVYNEMKGAFSAPDEVLGRYLKSALYPDTAYAFESGGDPEEIPNLTYEQFLDFHRTYYHPCNSYIFLYGNVDMKERLEWLDREYLCHYDEISVDSELHMQPPFEQVRHLEKTYSITEEESTEKKTYLTWIKSMGDALDIETAEALDILEYALMAAPGAPVRQALLNAGIGDDIIGGLDEYRELSFEITARGAEPEQMAQFEQIITDTLQDLAEHGINRKSLLAGININEFKAREADFGRYPTGLVYGLQALDGWLYDGDPMEELRYEKAFHFLREQLDTDYYEQLLRKLFLDNPHGLLLTLRPEKGLLERKEEEQRVQLAEKKAAMTETELAQIVEEMQALKTWQETEDSPEALATIPQLSLSDIETEPAPIILRERQIAGIPVLQHALFTSGIAYLKMMFDCRKLAQEDLGYVSILASVIGYVDTENYSYQDLSDEINIHTGGIDAGVGVSARVDDPEHPMVAFLISASSMVEKMSDLFRLTDEMLYRSDMTDTKHLQEILAEKKSRAQNRLTQTGHSIAVGRCQSHFSPAAWCNDQISGISYYHFLEDAMELLARDPERFIRKLQETAEKVLRKENLQISYTAAEEDWTKLEAFLPVFAEKLAAEPLADAPRAYEKRVWNEGFKFASQVNYDAQCGTFRDAGYAYHGSMRVLQTVLSYDYLWKQLREKGGAYGCMSGLSRDGNGYFVSYRDPKLAETYEVYTGVPEFLRQYHAEQKEMEKYIIGTISNMDIPLNPSAKGNRALNLYLAGVTWEDLKQERTEILHTTEADIRRLAGPVEAILAGGYKCVVGNSEQITKEAALFDETKALL